MQLAPLLAEELSDFFLQFVVQAFPLAEMFQEAWKKDLSKEAIEFLIFKMADGRVKGSNIEHYHFGSH